MDEDRASQLQALSQLLDPTWKPPLVHQIVPQAASAPLSYPPQTTSLPLSEFTNGNIRPTQTSVDPAGVTKYMKRIRAGDNVDPVQIAPDLRSGEGNWRIVDGHTRLKAYYNLGINNIPVSVRDQ